MVEGNVEFAVARKLYERIVAAPHALIALDTPDPADLVRQMRMLSIRQGTSVYTWEPENGLASLRESGLHVPGSKRLSDALRYVMQSMHFGVYLFVNYQDHLRPGDTLLLRRIERLQATNERKLVLIASRVELAEELDGLYERIAADAETAPRLRLRDGRWVT